MVLLLDRFCGVCYTVSMGAVAGTIPAIKQKYEKVLFVVVRSDASGDGVAVSVAGQDCSGVL